MKNRSQIATMKPTSAFSRRKTAQLSAHGSASRHSMPVAEHKFDPESGQVYSEMEVRPSRNKHSNWIGELKTPSLVKKVRPNEHGARSLADMTRIKIVGQLKNLTSEHFATIPWLMAEMIWEQLLSL